MIPFAEHSAPRRGAAVLAALVCLVLATLLWAAILRVGLARREQSHSDEQKAQAEWLAESGLERARARLAASAGYSGETWTVSADDLATRSGGIVRIRVERVGGGRGRWLVGIQAPHPSESKRPMRGRKQVIIG